MKHEIHIRAALIRIAIAALAAMTLFGAASADITTRIHYRCWDETLRVSHGGWVSLRYMAENNCAFAAKLYPNNVFRIQSEEY